MPTPSPGVGGENGVDRRVAFNQRFERLLHNPAQVRAWFAGGEGDRERPRVDDVAKRGKPDQDDSHN
jgi:hypothetical protein